MKMKAAYLSLWLGAAVDAAQFTQSFSEYSKENHRLNAFEEFKETMTASYKARRLGHTLPPFIVPSECDYDDLNHTPTSTNPIDQMVCPGRCGTGRDFTLRIATQCDKPYTDATAVCSSVIQCGVSGCTSGLLQCPPLEIIDFDSALDEACDILCDGPAPVAPVPVVAPVPAPVMVPVPAPVMVPVTAPVALPTPLASPVSVPVTTPVLVPSTPITTPVAVPSVPTVVTPTIDVPNCYSDTTLLLQDVVNANPAVVTTYSLCSNRVYNIGTLTNIAGSTSLVGGMAPLTARTNTHYICGANGDVSNNCVLTGGETQVISAFSLYQQPATNARFQGFTFAMAQQAGAVLDNSGDITFQDCIFEDHTNIGPMLLSWDPTVASTEPPLSPVAAPTTRLVRKMQATNSVQLVMNNMGAVMESVRQQKIRENPHGRGLQEDFVNENHSIPPSVTPPGCSYSFQHTDAVFMDEIFCPGYCGTGRDFTYTVTSVCSGNNCDTFTDCRVRGCNDACGDMVGDCSCTSVGFDSIFNNVCDDVCVAAPVATPVAPPIAGPVPVAAPVPTPALPTPALPTPIASPVAIPTPALPTPALPTPIASPVAIPTPALPTPALPTPALPTPALPTPALPTPALPTPALPTPALPTPALPTPALPTPALPTPISSPVALPTPAVPTPVIDPSLPRQQVRLVETTFRNNAQGLPVTDKSRGVVTTSSGYNDIIVVNSRFEDNTYNAEGFGYAILAVEGSTVEVSNTNFVGNDFIGVGTVVVLDGGSVSAANNFGTADDGLPCQFIAASASSASEAQCIDYDRSTEVPPSGSPVSVPTPVNSPVSVPTPVSSPVLGPISGKRTGVTMPSPIAVPLSTLSGPSSGSVPVSTSTTDMAPVPPSTESSAVRGATPSGTGDTIRSKKSKSSSYCDDSTENNGRRCLKRKST